MLPKLSFEDVYAYKEQEAFSTTPDIQHFGDWKLEHAYLSSDTIYNGMNCLPTSNDTCQNIRGRQLWSRKKVHVCGSIELGGRTLFESQHEEAYPDPAVGRVDCPFWPYKCSSFCFLLTHLGIGSDMIGIELHFLLISGLQTQGVRVSLVLSIVGVVEGVFLDFICCGSRSSDVAASAMALQIVEETHCRGVEVEIKTQVKI